jgi:hypothetical protein
LIDAHGQPISQPYETGEAQLNVQNVPNGLYLLKLVLPNGVRHIQRIQIQH